MPRQYRQLLKTADIKIEDKHGRIQEMSDEEVYKIYFNGTENERRLLLQTGAHADDIKAILYKYNKGKKELKSKNLVSSVHQDLLQAFFQHTYHERRKDNTNAVILANQLPDNTPRMKMYRAMGIEEFAAIKAWLENQNLVKGRLTVADPEINAAVNSINASPDKSIPIKHHLGGLDQALEYATPSPRNHKFLLEFTMSKTTPQLLQDPNIIALQKQQHERSTVGYIASWQRNRGNTPGEASQNEGHSDSRIGLKNENTGGESLSIAVGNDNAATQALFQSLITRIELYQEIKKK
jgi:hypothetical protein